MSFADIKFIGGVNAMEYKTIAGPIGLTAEKGQDYEDAVKKYAAIIDAEAVGGWDLLWIQQIPVIKKVLNVGGLVNFTLIFAVIGAAINVAVSMQQYGSSIGGAAFGGIVLGGLIGAAIGALVCRNKVVEFFNMLVFARKK